MSWITSISPSSGTAGATIGYAVSANTGAARVGHITVTGSGGSVQLTVSQDGLCTYTLTPASQSVPVGGGSFNTVLAITGACSGTWTAASDVSWITNVSPGSGTAGATIAYVVQANTGALRTGHITVTGPGGSVQLTVTQSAPPPPCVYALDPISQSVQAPGGPFSTVLGVTGTCSGNWTAASDVTWITNVAPTSGTAGATINYVVQANTGALRIGSVTVTGPGGSVHVTVTQAAPPPPCVYTLTPTSQSVPAAGGPFSTVLALAGACSGTWTAASDVSWITNVSPTSGTAGATINYVVQANTGALRIGRITVTGPGGSATLTVTQAQPPCTYTLNPATVTVPAAGGPFSTVLTLTASCSGTWSATSDVLWITAISPNSGTAGASISYRVSSNSGPQRIGHLNVTGPGGASASLTVTQDALIIGRDGLAQLRFSVSPEPGRPDPRATGHALDFPETSTYNLATTDARGAGPIAISSWMFNSAGGQVENLTAEQIRPFSTPLRRPRRVDPRRDRPSSNEDSLTDRGA